MGIANTATAKLEIVAEDVSLGSELKKLEESFTKVKNTSKATSSAMISDFESTRSSGSSVAASLGSTFENMGNKVQSSFMRLFSLRNLFSSVVGGAGLAYLIKESVDQMAEHSDQFKQKTDAIEETTRSWKNQMWNMLGSDTGVLGGMDKIHDATKKIGELMKDNMGVFAAWGSGILNVMANIITATIKVGEKALGVVAQVEAASKGMSAGVAANALPDEMGMLRDALDNIRFMESGRPALGGTETWWENQLGPARQTPVPSHQDSYSYDINGKIVNNFNFSQVSSRSDANAIAAEATRQAYRDGSEGYDPGSIW